MMVTVENHALDGYHTGLTSRRCRDVSSDEMICQTLATIPVPCRSYAGHQS